MGIFLRATERRVLVPWTSEPLIPPYPGADVGGSVTVDADPDRALMVPTVWGCVGLLANAVSSLRLETFDRSHSGVPSRTDDPPLIINPSSGMTQSAWIHVLMVSLLLRGNAIGRIVTRDKRTLYPTTIDLLHPDEIMIDVDPDTRRLRYRFRRNQQVIPLDDVWHVRGLTLPGSKVGLSPISYAAATLGIDLSSRQFASEFFAGGGIPKAVLKAKTNLNQEQAQSIKDKVMAVLTGREPLVLGADTDYQQISVNPEESQFLATQQANVAQIARYFWVPPEMVGGSGGNSMTYANVEQRSLDFLVYSVAPWLRRIEDALYSLLPDTIYAEFNTDALLRTDAETQARVDIQLLAGKILAPSEVRERRGLPPMTAAQKAEADMVPLTITPLGGPKGLPALHEPPGPVAPVPPTEEPPNG